MRARSVALACLLCLPCLLVWAPGCKESGNDHYAEGLRLLGEAERGACDLGYDKASGHQVINTGRITTCLERTKAGLEELYAARELGVKHREMNELIEKTEIEVEKLESMLKMVSRMQHTAHTPAEP